jgi:lipoprotein-anchoring transpeptidase ErfK/SrfK
LFRPDIHLLGNDTIMIRTTPPPVRDPASPFTKLTRRGFVLGAAAVVAGCQTMPGEGPVGGLAVASRAPGAANARPGGPGAVNPNAPTGPDLAYYTEMYAALPYERFPVPAVDVRTVDRRYLRQEVADPTGERPGTLVVDTAGPFLYLVRENGRAMRYGIGVGKDGFSWAGRADILMKREWPTWTPPAEMIARRPDLEPYRRGMEPGLENPLGARALYLFSGGRDTLYRIHGTNEPWSIGKAVSSGCIRLFNQDIIDLYARVPRGSIVVVKPHEGSAYAV